MDLSRDSKAFCSDQVRNGNQIKGSKGILNPLPVRIRHFSTDGKYVKSAYRIVPGAIPLQKNFSGEAEPRLLFRVYGLFGSAEGTACPVPNLNKYQRCFFLQDQVDLSLACLEIPFHQVQTFRLELIEGEVLSPVMR